MRTSADAARQLEEHPVGMGRKTYAVWWEEAEGSRHAGKLQLADRALSLSGNGCGRITVPVDAIVSVDYNRGELRLELKAGSDLRIGNLDGPGVLLELSDALAAV